jgi:hypothetical protein
VQWIKNSHLDVVNERHAAETIWTPEWNLARFLPRPDEESLHGQVHGEQIRMVGIEDPRRMKHKVGKKEQTEESYREKWSSRQSKISHSSWRQTAFLVAEHAATGKAAYCHEKA